MRIKTKNKIFLYHILLLVVEMPIVIFLSFFSLGEPEMMLNNYEAHPFESFVKSFTVVAIAMFIINFFIITLVEFFKFTLLKDRNVMMALTTLTRHLVISYLLIVITIFVTFLLKLTIRGYV